MCNYKLTVTLEKSVDVVDGGGWVTGMTWRKAVILEAGERASVLALRDLLNRSKPAMDDLGYMLWGRCYGMCNRQCWQWELVSAHTPASMKSSARPASTGRWTAFPASTSPSSPSTLPSTDLRKGERWTPNESWDECADCWR